MNFTTRIFRSNSTSTFNSDCWRNSAAAKLNSRPASLIDWISDTQELLRLQCSDQNVARSCKMQQWYKWPYSLSNLSKWHVYLANNNKQHSRKRSLPVPTNAHLSWSYVHGTGVDQLRYTVCTGKWCMQVVQACHCSKKHHMQCFWQQSATFTKYTAAENEVTALMYMIGIHCFSRMIQQTLPWCALPEWRHWWFQHSWSSPSLLCQKWQSPCHQR